MKLIKTLLLVFSVFSLFYQGLRAQEYDAGFEKLVREYTLNPDGSQDYREIRELRYNTHFAFHRLFGETFIVYNPLYQALTINDSYTIMAGGKKVVTPGNAFNELLPGFAADAPAFNELREMAVTHTGLEVGALTHLDYTISTDSGFYPGFFGQESLLETVPADHLEVIVRIPEEGSLRFRVLNIRTSPDVFLENGYKVYRWSFSNLKAKSRDRFADPEADPFIYFSMTDLAGAIFRFTDQDAFRHRLGTTLEKRVDSLVKIENDGIRRMLLLQKLVIDELKHKDIPLKYTGYRIRTPEQVWESGYGTVAERAVLLADLLLHAGINAIPVAAVPDEHFSRDYGNPGLLQDFYVQANPVTGNRTYLSVEHSDDQNNVYGLSGLTLIQLDAAIESIRTFEEEEPMNTLSASAYISLDENSGMAGEMEFEVTSGWNPFFRLLSDSAYAGRYLQPGKNIEEIVMDRISEARSSGKILLRDTLPFNNRGDYFFFDLPVYNAGFDIGSVPRTWQQETSLVEFPSSFSKNYYWGITLPTGWKMLNENIELSAGNDAGEVHMVVRQDGNHITIQKYLEIKERKLDTPELDHLSELVDIWVMGNISTLIFKKPGSE